MPIRTAIWKVAAQPELLAESSLAKEHLLEAMIVAAPRLLSEEWMLIGRTGKGDSNFSAPFIVATVRLKVACPFL